jgi:hypothetical protein
MLKGLMLNDQAAAAVLPLSPGLDNTMANPAAAPAANTGKGDGLK